MLPVSPCTTQNLKRSVKRFSVWIVAEVRRLLVVKGKACTRIAINKSGKQQ